jgi:hypothetical protein
MFTKYNIFKSSNNSINFKDTISSILLLPESNINSNNNSYNSIYNELYNCYLNGKIDFYIFFDTFRTKIESINLDNNLNKQLIFFDHYLKKLDIFTSFFISKKLTYNNCCISCNLNKIVVNLIIGNNDIDNRLEKFNNDIIYNVSSEVQVDDFKSKYSLNILGKMFAICNDCDKPNNNNNTDEKKELECKNDDSDLNLKHYNYFVDKFILQYNKYLKLQYDGNKYDICNVCENINIVNKYMNDNLKMNLDKIMYEKCYSLWTLTMIEQINIANNKSEKIIDYLGMISSNITDNKLTIAIINKFNSLIDDVFNTELQSYSDLSTILSYIYIIINKCVSQDSLKHSIIDKLNEMFEQKSNSLTTYNDMFDKNIVEESHNFEQVSTFQKHIYGFTTILYTKFADQILKSYLDNMINRYIKQLENNKLNSCKYMYVLDNIIYELLNTTIDDSMKNHVIGTLNKIKNVLNDINVSIIANKEFNNININYVDKFNNVLDKPKFDKNNILYLVTSGGNNWSNTYKHISNHFNINYNKDIKYMISPFNNYYKEKTNQRKLRWLNDLSTVVLNYHLNNNSYKLKLTLLQSTVLMMFTQDKKIISFDKICDEMLKDTDSSIKTCIEHIKKVCKSLVDAKILINTGNNYEIDLNLKIPKKYIDEPINIVKYFYKAKVDNQLIANEIMYDRINTIKCYIIKLFKKMRKESLNKETVFCMLNDTLRLFNYTQEDINSVLEQLVKSYYLDKIGVLYKYSDE